APGRLRYSPRYRAYRTPQWFARQLLRRSASLGTGRDSLHRLLSEGLSLLFALSLVLRERHPFADDFTARLVFRLHAQSFALNGGRRQHNAASAASGLGKAMKIRPPQLAT